MRKRSKMKLCALTMMGLTMLTSSAVLAEDEIIPMETEIEGMGGGGTADPQSYIYEWRYKIENNHIYKRLYNRTKERWEGDWILVY